MYVFSLSDIKVKFTAARYIRHDLSGIKKSYTHRGSCFISHSMVCAMKQRNKLHTDHDTKNLN